jgi:hypothetical protein
LSTPILSALRGRLEWSQLHATAQALAFCRSRQCRPLRSDCIEPHHLGPRETPPLGLGGHCAAVRIETYQQSDSGAPRLDVVRFKDLRSTRVTGNAHGSSPSAIVA